MLNRVNVTLYKEKALIVTGKIGQQTISEAFFLIKKDGEIVWDHAKATLRQQEANTKEYEISYSIFQRAKRINKKDKFQEAVQEQGVDNLTKAFRIELGISVLGASQVAIDCPTVPKTVLNSELLQSTSVSPAVQMRVMGAGGSNKDPEAKKSVKQKNEAAPPASEEKTIIEDHQARIKELERELKEFKDGKTSETKKTAAKEQNINWLRLMVQLIAVGYAGKPSMGARFRTWRRLPLKFDLKKYDAIFKSSQKVSVKMYAVLELLVKRFSDFLDGNNDINNKLNLASLNQARASSVQFKSEHYTGRLVGKLLQKIIALSEGNGTFSVFKDIIKECVSPIRDRLNAANLDAIGQTTLKDEFPDFINKLNTVSPSDSDEVNAALRAIEVDVYGLLNNKQKSHSNERSIPLEKIRNRQSS